MSKTLNLLCVCLLLGSIVTGTVHAQLVQTRRALLVGIGAYQEGWPAERPLQSGFGVQLIRQRLLELGFEAGDLVTLQDSAATLMGMRAAMQSFAESVAEGDRLVFFYYGHGARVLDDNGDEVDGRDEVLLPYDGAWASESVHQNVMRDDELGRWAEALRRRAGPDGQLLVILDACHSGSAMRGGGLRSESENRTLLSAAPVANMAPMVVLYSSRPHQSSLEMLVEGGMHCALLTWSLFRALEALPEEVTYRALFERTAGLMARRTLRQTPEWEGQLDMQLFGDRVAAPPAYCRVRAVLDERSLLLDGGLLQAFRPGTRVRLYPPDTRDTLAVPALGRGVIRESMGLTGAVLELDGDAPGSVWEGVWVFADGPVLPEGGLFLSIDAEDKAVEAELRNGLAGVRALYWCAPDQAGLHLEVRARTLTLRDAGGRILWRQKWDSRRPDPGLEALQQELERIQRARFLIDLETEAREAEVVLRAYLEPESPLAGESVPMALRRNRDVLALQVINQGAQSVYYTILDIDPRYEVQVLIPGPSRLASEYLLGPGQAGPVHRVRFDLPGQEVLKLVATPIPLDLRDEVARRGGRFTPEVWQALLSPGAKGVRRGPAGPVAASEIRPQVHSLVLDIIDD